MTGNMTGFNFPGLKTDDLLNPPGTQGIPGIENVDEEILRKKKEERDNKGRSAIPRFNDPSAASEPGVPTWQQDLDRDIGLSGGRTLSKSKDGTFNEGPLKGLTKGQAYEKYKSKGGRTVDGPTRTAVQSASGEILSTGTQKVDGSSSTGLLDRGTAEVRRARLDQGASKAMSDARSAVRGKKVEQQDQREYDNMQIASRGYSSKNGVTRFYGDDDRTNAAISAQASQEAQALAKDPAKMGEAQALAKQSVDSDRTSAPSTAGRATVVETDPKYTPFGSPGYGVGGVSLTDNKSSDKNTGSGMGMSLDAAKGINQGASIPGIQGESDMAKGARSALRLDAGDRIGSAIRDTVMNQYEQSGGIPGLSSPEAMSKKSPAPNTAAKIKKYPKMT